jgi:hypothetical protein
MHAAVDPLDALIASPFAALVSSAIGYRARRAAAAAKLEHLRADQPRIEARMRQGDPSVSFQLAATDVLIRAATNELELVERAEQKTRAELAVLGVAAF